MCVLSLALSSCPSLHLYFPLSLYHSHYPSLSLSLSLSRLRIRLYPHHIGPWPSTSSEIWYPLLVSHSHPAISDTYMSLSRFRLLSRSHISSYPPPPPPPPTPSAGCIRGMYASLLCACLFFRVYTVKYCAHNQLNVSSCDGAGTPIKQITST